MIKEHPNEWKYIFCCDSKDQKKLTKNVFQDLYEINWSVAGSNDRAREEDTIYSWEVFLQDIDGNF